MSIKYLPTHSEGILKPNFSCVGAAPFVDRSDIAALARVMSESLIPYSIVI